MLLLLFSLLSAATAYPTGAPVDVCQMWTAMHDNHLPQSSQPPYQLNFDSDSVTLTGSQPFKGFFIQGQDETTKNPIGKFQSQATIGQTVDCSGPGSEDSVTHVGRDDKTSVTFKWQAPDSFNGKVQFRAIVVQNYTTFWNNVYSTPVTILRQIEESEDNTTVIV